MSLRCTLYLNQNFNYLEEHHEISTLELSNEIGGHPTATRHVPIGTRIQPIGTVAKRSSFWGDGCYFNSSTWRSSIEDVFDYRGQTLGGALEDEPRAS